MDFARQGRIVYVSMVDLSLPKGPSVNEREFLIALLDSMGDRVRAIIPEPQNALTEVDAARTHFFPAASNRQPVRFLRSQVSLRRKTERLIHEFRPDLVVARVGLLPWALSRLAETASPICLKTLDDPKGFAIKNVGIKGLAARSVAPLHEYFLRRLLKRTVAADTCTTELKQLYCAEYAFPEGNLAIVENSTNVNRFRPTDPTEARKRLGMNSFSPLIGFVGGFPEQRGGLELLEVTKRLLGDYPSIGVAVVGKCDSGALHRRAKELGILDRAILPGLVPYEAVPDYVNSFDIGFATGDLQWTGRVGNSYQKVRQYLACGKPVVTCVSKDSPLGRSGLVECVTPGDVEMIEAATRRILARDQHQRLTQREDAIRVANEKYSSAATLRQRMKLWGDVISQEAPRTKAA